MGFLVRQFLIRGRRLIEGCALGAHWLVGYICRFLPLTRRAWRGNDPNRTRGDHAVYAHYDPEGVVHDYVLDQLRQLAEAGFRVTFVSNARRRIDGYVDLVGAYCREVIWRYNRGYDFGAYKDGIAAIGDLKNCDRLLLMNDSVYGPFWPLSEVLEAANSSDAEIWGITDSWAGHFHIQGYFVLLHKKAIALPAFRKFWSKLPYVNSKSWIIRYAEIRLTQKLTQNKLRASVLCPYWDVARSVLAKIEAQLQLGLTECHNAYLERAHSSLQFGRPLNPTHYFWDALIAEFHCPFIKRELIRENPAGIIYNWRWSELIGRVSDYDLDLIRHHLQAT